MRKNTIRRVFGFAAPTMLPTTVLLATFLAGCGSDLKGEMMGEWDPNDPNAPQGYQELTITNPQDGAYYPSQLVVVQGYSETDGEVLVNGEATTATDGMYSHTLRLREEGAHTITVQVPETGAERKIDIILDTTAPKFTLTKPSPSSFITGTTVEVEGTVDDANVDYITLGDHDFGVKADGSFMGLVDVTKGAHHWRIEASDLAGNVTPGSVSFLAGDFSTNSARTQEAVTLELGPDMLDAVAARIEPEITAPRIRSALTATNPVVSDWYGNVHINGYSHREVAVSVLPRDGYLSVALSIGGVRVPYTFNPAIGGAISGAATSVAISVTGRVYVGIDSAGKPTARISNINAALIGFAVEVSGWPDEVDAFVTKQLRSTLQQAVTDILKGEVPNAVREALSGLPQQGDFAILEYEGRASGRLRELSVTDAGLYASVDLGVQAVSPDATLAAKSGPFKLGHKAPTRTGTRDAHVRVALDLVNRVLHAAWTTGAGKFTVESPVLPSEDNPTEITVGSLSLLFPSIKGMADDDSSIDLDLEAALPPIVRADGTQGVIAAPDVRVKVLAKQGSERSPLFELSVLARAHVDFSFKGNTLAASIADYQIMIDAVGDVPDGFKSGEELQELFEKLLLPHIEPFLALTPLEIPEIPGSRINAQAAELSDGYVEARGELTVH